MKLLFNNTNFLVIIGAKPFDDIDAVANCVLDYIVHLDSNVLKSSLAKANAIVEITDNDIDTSEEDDNVPTADVIFKFTLKSTGTGEFNVEDNDKLHLEWLAAFDSVLRASTIKYWNDFILHGSSNE